VSESLRIILFTFLGILALNIVVTLLQMREAKDRAIAKTSLVLWTMTVALFLIAGLLSQTMGPTTTLGFSLDFLQSIALVRFSELTLETRNPRKQFWIVFGVSMVLFALFAAAGASFAVYTFPIAFGVAFPLFWLVYTALKEKRWKQLSVAAKMFIAACAIFAVHHLDFPFLRPNPDAAIFGAALMLAIMQLFSVIMPTLAHEARSRNYEEELKREVDLKTQMLLSSSKMVALGEMAGGVAHEINSPLTIITHYVSFLQEYLEQPDFDRAVLDKRLKTINQTAWRIAKIINGLRTFSRDSELDPPTTTTVQALIDETMGLCSEKFKTHGIEIRILPFDPSLTVKCRSVQVSQVLLNLLNNAYDAIRDLPERWIELRAEQLGNMVRISITDSGNGIPAEVREKIFQPFFTTKPVGQGTGLGLSVSAGIMQAHGGKIWVNAAAPHTEFVFSLPA
jgi:signal transduction histidine kinase